MSKPNIFHAALVALGFSTLPFIYPAQAEPIIGPQKILTILINFSDQPFNQPWQSPEVTRLLYGTVNQFVLENSYHTASLDGKTAGWFTYPEKTDAFDCSEENLKKLTHFARDSAEKAGNKLSDYPYFVYLFPKNPSCHWPARSTIGKNSLGYSETWINGSLSAYTLGHELGHAFGLFHANTYKCKKNKSIRSCVNQELADPTDIMGGKFSGHYNAFHKEQLGWLGFDTIETGPVQVAMTEHYFLQPLESLAGGGPAALRIFRSRLADGSKDYYSLEFRQQMGADRLLPVSLTRGILIRHINDKNPDSSHLLNMGQQRNSFLTAALAPRQEFVDPHTDSGQLIIRVNSASPSGANISIVFVPKNSSTPDLSQ
jgi:hypothetical protein